MIKVYTAKLGDLMGVVHLEKLGYTWKIKARIDGKIVILGSSCVYLAHKEKAIEQLLNTMQVINKQNTLFNINDY